MAVRDARDVHGKRESTFVVQPSKRARRAMGPLVDVAVPTDDAEQLVDLTIAVAPDEQSDDDMESRTEVQLVQDIKYSVRDFLLVHARQEQSAKAQVMVGAGSAGIRA